MFEGIEEISLLSDTINQTKVPFAEPIPENIPHLSKFLEWDALLKNHRQIHKTPPSELFSNIKQRTNDFTLEAANINLNFSLQPINNQTIQNLCSLAENFNLDTAIDKLFNGANVNTNANKPALHTALRDSYTKATLVDNKNITPQIQACHHEMQKIANSIRSNTWFYDKNKVITDIVNVGIGGSNLGPKMANHTLQYFSNTTINFHCLASDDPKLRAKLLYRLNLNTTIFIVTSKSFTTKETIANLNAITNLLGNEKAISEHIIAITNNSELAKEYKITTVLPIWDWVGGRYSFCSAVNLSLMIMIGPKLFLRMLSGAKAMDMHFKNAPFTQNLPVILALLGIWNINFNRSFSHLILVYSQLLRDLPEFLQQLDMESNGKSINKNNSSVVYSTSPIIWGGEGSHAEHAYYQFLLQGTHFNCIDYFFIADKDYIEINQVAYKKIIAISKGTGNTNANFIRTGINLLTIQQMSPESLGALVALYEHKTYCQSVLWDINAFNQPGVEAIKKFVAD